MDINFQDLFKLLHTPIVECNRNNLKPAPPGSPLAACGASEDLIVCSQQEGGSGGSSEGGVPSASEDFLTVHEGDPAPHSQIPWWVEVIGERWRGRVCGCVKEVTTFRVCLLTSRATALFLLSPFKLSFIQTSADSQSFCMYFFCSNNRLDLHWTFRGTQSTLRWTQYSSTLRLHWWWWAECVYTAAMGQTGGSMAASLRQMAPLTTSHHLIHLRSDVLTWVNCLPQRHDDWLGRTGTWIDLLVTV